MEEIVLEDTIERGSVAWERMKPLREKFLQNLPTYKSLAHALTDPEGSESMGPWMDWHVPDMQSHFLQLHKKMMWWKNLYIEHRDDLIYALDRASEGMDAQEAMCICL